MGASRVLIEDNDTRTAVTINSADSFQYDGKSLSFEKDGATYIVRAIADTYTGGVQYAEEKTSESYTSSGMRYIGNGHVLVVLGTCPASKNADTAVNSVVSSVLESAVPASDDGNITVSGVPMNISNCQVSFTNNLALVKKDGFELRFIPSTYQSDAIAFGLVGTTSSGASVSHGDYASTDGTEVYLIESGAGKKLNADNQWSVMFSNLPKYANGKTIDYTLTEEAVPGYTSSITRNGKSFTLINTHVDETKNITITKAWNDENNQDGLRPKSITAVVNGSDGSARFVQLFESQHWTTSLNNLPKYKNSTEVQYTVKENAISGYETEIKQTGD